MRRVSVCLRGDGQNGVPYNVGSNPASARGLEICTALGTGLLLPWLDLWSGARRKRLTSHVSLVA